MGKLGPQLEILHCFPAQSNGRYVGKGPKFDKKWMIFKGLVV